MGRSNLLERLRALTKDPEVHLAYRGLRHAMKSADRSLRDLSDGFVIFIVPAGHRAQAYKQAAHVIWDSEAEEWGLPRHTVRLAKPPLRKGSVEKQVSTFDLRDLRVLIASHVSEAPKDVRFAAQKIVHLEPPGVLQINAARRAIGRCALSDEHAQLLVGRPLNVLLAGIFKKKWKAEDAAALKEIDQPDVQGPDLFDLPGYEGLKDWVSGLKADVVRWRDGGLLWKDVSRGALVAGPPATGKTFFAAALANSLKFRLITTTVGTWQSAGHLDEMLNAMRKCFEEANNGHGTVLFIDEFDSIGSRPSRPTGDTSAQYWQVVVNEFLNLMNNAGDGVIIIGATNHPDWIDPAILRAGRLEQRFTLGLPDTFARAEILRYHTAGAFDLETLIPIANDLEGKAGACIEEMVRVARKVARDENRELELRDLQACLPEKRRYTPQQRSRLAVHESGHALVALAVGYASSATIEIKDSFDPSAASYIGGTTSYDLIEDHVPTEKSLYNRILVSLAGMAAEQAVFGERSLGSGGVVGSDVERATSIARRMVASYGLGKVPLFWGTAEDVADMALPDILENEIVDILRSQYEWVLALLADQRERLIALAAEVVVNNVVVIEADRKADAA